MLRRYFAHSRLLSVSLILILPLFILYEVGLFIVGMEVMNGADLVTRNAHRLLGDRGFLISMGFLLGISCAGAFWLYRKHRLRWNYFAPLLAETTTYGFTMGFIIVFILGEVGLAGPTAAQGTFRNIVLSAGAGLFEELFFRLALFTAMLWLWKRFLPSKSQWFKHSVIILVTSLIFSFAHFGGSPWSSYRFVYLTFAGLIFGVLYTTRGLAVAVYTHTLYDIWVLEVNPLLPW